MPRVATKQIFTLPFPCRFPLWDTVCKAGQNNPSTLASITLWNLTLPLFLSRDSLFLRPSTWTCPCDLTIQCPAGHYKMTHSRGLKSTCAGWTPISWPWLEARTWMGLSPTHGWMPWAAEPGAPLGAKPSQANQPQSGHQRPQVRRMIPAETGRRQSKLKSTEIATPEKGAQINSCCSRPLIWGTGLLQQQLPVPQHGSGRSRKAVKQDKLLST